MENMCVQDAFARSPLAWLLRVLPEFGAPVIFAEAVCATVIFDNNI